MPNTDSILLKEASRATFLALKEALSSVLRRGIKVNWSTLKLKDPSTWINARYQMPLVAGAKPSPGLTWGQVPKAIVTSRAKNIAAGRMVATGPEFFPVDKKRVALGVAAPVVTLFNRVMARRNAELQGILDSGESSHHLWDGVPGSASSYLRQKMEKDHAWMLPANVKFKTELPVPVQPALSQDTPIEPSKPAPEDTDDYKEESIGRRKKLEFGLWSPYNIYNENNVPLNPKDLATAGGIED
jgi:hypothetical protein